MILKLYFASETENGHKRIVMVPSKVMKNGESNIEVMFVWL